MKFLTLRDVDVNGRRVLLRVDFNVPMKDGAIVDASRIDAALPTLRYLREHGALTMVLSHLGRPKEGRPDPKLSLRPIAAYLSQRLGTPVAFAGDCIGGAVAYALSTLPASGVLLLENVRYHPEEEANDPNFAEKLSEFADLYVNDAFGTAHRAHASTEGITHCLPAVAGLLMETELKILGRLVSDPEQPFVCAIGGAKVKDKVGIFTHLLERVSSIVIGGGMANTFLAAGGVDVGTSIRDDDLKPARQVLAQAERLGKAIHLPVDAIVAPSFDADDQAQTVRLNEINGRMILDIGPETARRYGNVLRAAKTIVFNGPMGVYEKSAYQAGTRAIGEAIAQATATGAVSVVGGGDAAAAAHILGFAAAMTYVSTGGGATLEFLEGRELPGVAALERAALAHKP
jgi:phosphoglycerate kinase